MLVNLSNHPSGDWPAAQLEAALRMESSIVDLPFPNVDPSMDGAEFDALALATVRQVIATGAPSAMVQGEPTMVFMVVNMLREARVRCYAATTARDSSMENTGDGGIRKTSLFRFVKFREYREH